MRKPIDVWRAQNLGQLQGLLAMTILDAPDDFEVLDFLAPEQQLTFEKAFEELSLGLGLVEKRLRDEEKVSELRRVLAASKAAYLEGDSRAGALLLQDLDRLITEGLYPRRSG